MKTAVHQMVCLKIISIGGNEIQAKTTRILNGIIYKSIITTNDQNRSQQSWFWMVFLTRRVSIDESREIASPLSDQHIVSDGVAH